MNDQASLYKSIHLLVEHEHSLKPHLPTKNACTWYMHGKVPNVAIEYEYYKLANNALNMSLTNHALK